MVGRTLLELGIWDVYQRAEFLRALYREGSLKDYVMQLTGQAGKLAPFNFFANQNEIKGERYVVMMAREAGQGK